MTKPNSMNLFERQLTLWVGLCIVGGILLGTIECNSCYDLCVAKMRLPEKLNRQGARLVT